MEEIRKEHFLNKFIYVLVLILAILYTDSYGIVTILGCYSLVYLFGKVDSNQKQYSIRTNKTILYVSSVLLIFLIMFIFNYTDYNVSYSKDNFVIVPSFWLVVFFAIPLVYYFLKKKTKKPPKNLNICILIILLVLYKSAIHILVNPQISIDTYGGIYGVISNLFQVVFWAAVMEELLFRFYLYDFGKDIFGIKGSAFISALLFMLFHFNVIEQCFFLNLSGINNLIAIFFLGLFLAILSEYTNSIIVCIIFHAMVDGLIEYCYLLVKYYSVWRG